MFIRTLEPLPCEASHAHLLTERKRPVVIARIRGRGNKDTELALAKVFRAHHLTGWRRHRPVFGKPDFVFPKRKVAVFVDGCFWHGCPRHATWPANRAAWWRRKILGNRARDARVTRALRRAGWRVLRVWEHELARKNEARLVSRLRRALG